MRIFISEKIPDNGRCRIEIIYEMSESVVIHVLIITCGMPVADDCKQMLLTRSPTGLFENFVIALNCGYL